MLQYLVLHAGWCLTTERAGCALTEVWDAEEPELRAEGREPVCPGLWHNTPLPFVKVFMNTEYAVLRVSPSKLEISSSSNSQEM